MQGLMYGTDERMSKRLRDCSNASHEEGVREGCGQINRLLTHAHLLSTSSVFWNLAIGLVQRSPLNRNLVTITDKNAFKTNRHQLKRGRVNSRIY